MTLEQLQRFINESRLVPQSHALKLLAVAKAAKAVEVTSGTSISDLVALSEALYALERE